MLPLIHNMFRQNKHYSDQEAIRVHNTYKILNYVQKKRECTKQAIGSELSLSIPTVTNNLNELVKKGIISELGQGKSSGGRRPRIYSFNPKGVLSQGIEITPHGIRSAIVDLDGEFTEVTESEKVPRTRAELFDLILDFYRKGKHTISKEKTIYAGLGISLPGVVDSETRYLVNAVNLHLSAIDFRALHNSISDRLFIENEANAAAIAEKIKYGSPADSDILYLSITEGVGAGIFLHNHLYRGRRNKAGEIGHITLIPDGKKCNCGQSGCLERYVSEGALLEAYYVKCNVDISSIDVLMNKVEQGECCAVEIWEQYLTFLALGIQNLLHMFDPATVIIGGRLSKYAKLLEQQLSDRIFFHEGLQTHSDVVIKCSQLGSDGALLGAGLLSFDHLHY